MLRALLKALWKLVTLPVTLVLLPFKIASLLVSLVVYGTVLALIGVAVLLVL